MNTNNPKDNKFGLPKPDFQSILKKHPAWPVVIGALICIFCVTVKILYSIKSPDEEKKQDTVESQSTFKNIYSEVDNNQQEDYITDNVEVNESLSSSEVFDHKKDVKAIDNIKVIKQRLEEEEKNPRSLVKSGTYQELHRPQGIYHLVVVSYLRKETAMKSVRKLIKKNLGVYLILPRKGEKYYRVTIAHSRTLYEAERQLKRFKSIYKNLFILQY